VGFHLLVLGEPADELAAQGGLAGADLADDDVQAPTQMQRQLELLEAVQVLAGVVEVIRVRQLETVPGSG
jgi:hypothetical protein